jgi:hypothetical protein
VNDGEPPVQRIYERRGAAKPQEGNETGAHCTKSTSGVRGRIISEQNESAVVNGGKEIEV